MGQWPKLARREKLKGKKVLPPTYLFFAIVSMTALHFLYPVMKIVHWPWSVLGLIPLACGVVINVVADNAFRKVKTAVRPFEESSTLVTRVVGQ